MKRPRIRVREVLASTRKETRKLLSSGKVFKPITENRLQRV